MSKTSLKANGQAESPPSLVVCEKSGVWASRLRHRLPAAPLNEARSLAQCEAFLAVARSSVVVLEARSDNLDLILSYLVRGRRWYPRAVFVVASGREGAGLKRVFREAGAAATLSSPRWVPELGRLVQRQLASFVAPAEDWLEAIWTSLPWAALATDAGELRSTLLTETNHGTSDR